MGFAKGEASGYVHLLDRLRQFARGWAHPNKPTFAGVGTGQLTQVSATAATVAETWTLTCTAAAVNGGTFSVLGSVSGAQANATVGVAYANAYLSFLLTDGATDFQVGDAFTAVVQAPLAAADRWVEDRWVAGPPAELIMHGPGAGADAIYVGVTTYFDAGADYYNWKLQGFTGYQPAMAFGAQPGAILDRTPHVPLWQNAIPYWFMVSARRLLVVAKVSTVYEACYLGFLQPYATPNQYPYPLLIGGSLAFLGAEPAATSTAWRWSATPIEHRLPFEPGTQSNITSLEDQMCAVRLRNPAGAWRGFASLVSSAYIAGTLTGGNPANAPPTAANTTLRGNLIWPGCSKTTGFNVRQAMDGSPILQPIVLCSSDEAPNPDGVSLIGELEGCYALSGAGVATEDIVQIGGVDHLVVPNVFRTTRYDFFAVRLG
jgi:hypothetical protein